MNEFAEERKPFVNSDDQTLLLIKGNIADKDECKRYIKRTANAILQVIQKHGTAKLRCVGAAALNNGIKAQIIASGDAKTKGIDLICTNSFQTVNFGDSGDKTSIVIDVSQR
jgi:stage V sporulation protein SpoVS